MSRRSWAIVPCPSYRWEVPPGGAGGHTDPQTASAPSPDGAPLDDQQPQAHVTHKETNT